MSEEEKRDAVLVAESLGPLQIADSLEDLIARERVLLESAMGDMREIVLHNVAVLTAACAGYREAARKAGLAEPEQG